MFTSYKKTTEYIWSIVTGILLSNMIRITDDTAHILFVGLYIYLGEDYTILWSALMVPEGI